MCTRNFTRAIAFFTLLNLSLNAADWAPVSPADLSLKTPKLDPKADAETMLWKVNIADEIQGEDVQTLLRHYVRTKIYTQRGVEKYSDVELAYGQDASIVFLEGRTIKRDGTIVELKKNATRQRDIVKTSGRKLRATTFQMPSVEPGAVVEYQYTEVRHKQLANYLRLYFQRDTPSWEIIYQVKPLSIPMSGYTMRNFAFNVPNKEWERGEAGYAKMAMSNMPAFVEEPDAPPEDQIRAWLLLFYSNKDLRDPDKFWKEYGRNEYRDFKKLLKINDEIKRTANEVAAAGGSPEEKLQLLADFCRTKIKNIYSDSSGLTAEARAKIKFKDNVEPADTLKSGIGTSFQINVLFAALATAAGFDARKARIPDSEDVLFHKTLTDGYFLSSYDIAIKSGEKWTFFDPGSPYLQPGRLRWQEEGQWALVSDDKEPLFVQAQASPPAANTVKRTAKLKLEEDGTLAGTVTVEMTGHGSQIMKNLLDSDSEAEREKYLTDRLKERLGAVEASNVKMENVTDFLKPYRYSYAVKIPGYAQRTGRRLFFQPSFFTKGVSARFPAAERKHDIMFRYGFVEDDQVTIELPYGFKLENAARPPSSKLGQVGEYAVNIRTDEQQANLFYERKFTWGNEQKTYFAASAYGALKQAFDMMHEADNHTMTLRKE